MPIDDFFPARPASAPTIYAVASKQMDHAGLLSVVDIQGWGGGSEGGAFE